MKINVSEEFSKTPGGRYKSEGEFSGEAFLDDILEPLYMVACQKKEKLIIDLDGTYGYATSFLEEAFGGLARRHAKSDVLSIITIISQDEPRLSEKVLLYVKEAKKK